EPGAVHGLVGGGDRWGRLEAAAGGRGQGHQALVAGAGGEVVAQAPAAAAGDQAEAGLEHAGEEAVVEGLVEVPHRPELVADPARLDLGLVGDVRRPAS